MSVYLAGTPTVPPPPGGFVLTDQVDGTLWLLTSVAGAPALIDVSTTWRGPVYDPYLGPDLQDDWGRGVRLTVASGALSATYVDPSRVFPLILTRPTETDELLVLLATLVEQPEAVGDDIGFEQDELGWGADDLGWGLDDVGWIG